MREEWQSISFGLWLTDSNNPDDSPRTATLRYSSCQVVGQEERRTFLSEYDDMGVVASVNSSDPQATTLTLVTRAAGGALRESAPLGSYAHRRVYFKGVGIDSVDFRDWSNGGNAYVKNVFVIPEGAVIKRPAQ
jgi:hypothetical protein